MNSRKEGERGEGNGSQDRKKGGAGEIRNG